MTVCHAKGMTLILRFSCNSFSVIAPFLGNHQFLASTCYYNYPEKMHLLIVRSYKSKCKGFLGTWSDTIVLQLHGGYSGRNNWLYSIWDVVKEFGGKWSYNSVLPQKRHLGLLIGSPDKNVYNSDIFTSFYFWNKPQAFYKCSCGGETSSWGGGARAFL